MEIAIIECTTDCNTQDAHVRQAEFIRDYFIEKGHNCTIYYNNTINVNKKYDIIIKSYSAFYEDYINQAKLFRNNKENSKIFYITNEYTVQSAGILGRTEFKNYNKSIITNFSKDKILGQSWKNKYSVNLNSLFYQPKQKQEKKYNICYYGTYRKNRVKYFKKYFVSKDFILSTSPKSIKKFVKDGCIFTPCKRFLWGKEKDTLGLFKYSLYIEDEWIHDNFHNLADRFYEALSNETVILFDKSCINTLRKSELRDVNYQDFLIDSYEDYKKRNYEEDLRKQKEWIKIIEKEKEKTFNQLEQIIIGTK